MARKTDVVSFRDLAIGDQFVFAREVDDRSALGMARGPWTKQTYSLYAYSDDPNRYGNVRVGTTSVKVIRINPVVQQWPHEDVDKLAEFQTDGMQRYDLADDTFDKWLSNPALYPATDWHPYVPNGWWGVWRLLNPLTRVAIASTASHIAWQIYSRS